MGFWDLPNFADWRTWYAVGWLPAMNLDIMFLQRGKEFTKISALFQALDFLLI